MKMFFLGMIKLNHFAPFQNCGTDFDPTLPQ